MALQKRYILAAGGNFKKAWALQKRAQGKSASPKKRAVQTRNRGKNMAKKKKKSYSRKSGLMAGLGSPLVSGITYAVVQPVVSNLLKNFNVGVQDEFLQIGAALAAKALFKNAIVNNYANAAIIVNTASLVGGYTSGMFGGGASSSAVNNGMGVIG